MTFRPILTFPDARLRRRASPIDGVPASARRLFADLMGTLKSVREGVGLSAPQIGVSLRACVVRLEEDDGTRRKLYLANPRIVAHSEEKLTAAEGCLSIPGYVDDVTRPAAVTVAYRDEDGHSMRLDAEGFLARCLQHEIDHLDGILFLDRLPPLARRRARRALARMGQLAVVGAR